MRRAPLLIFGLYLFNLVIAVPLALAMRSILMQSLGASLDADSMLRGFDLLWHETFAAAHRGQLADTFGPGVTGPLPILANLERLFEGNLLTPNPFLALPAVLYLFAWAFFAGGILDRYAHPEAPHLRVRFFSHCAEFFPAFTQLLLLAIFCYWAIFRFIAAPLHRWVENATLQVTVERTVLAAHLAVYLFTALLLMLVTLVLDYARVSCVVARRRTALAGLTTAVRFLLRHPLRTSGLYLALAVITGILLWLYARFAPGALQSTPGTILAAFLFGQLFIVARIVVKLWNYASPAVLMQALRPEPPEPAESAVAESVAA
jgi:hypothetical protein